MSSSASIAYKVLDTILHDFGASAADGKSKVIFQGDIPDLGATESEHILFSLVGAIPATANALLAAQIYEARAGQPQRIRVDVRKAHNYIDPNIGMNPSINGQEVPLDAVIGNPYLRNFFETKDGRYVVPSAVYVELAYQWSSFFSCSMNEGDVRDAIKQWNAQDLEAACAEVGLPLAMVRSEEEWLATEQGQHLLSAGIVPSKQVTDAPRKPLSANPRRPLEGIKVLCMTHAIAGPSAGRTLAEHGASVLQIMYTHGFEHSFVYTYANLGCASSRLNLHKEADRAHLWKLVGEADVWIDSYREGAITKFGYDDDALHKANPSLIISHVRCYGSSGPWASRPGFDMQGSAVSGMMALCGDGAKAPAWPPGMVINDYTTGYYGALAIQVAILRRMRHGGGYVLSPSLAGTAMSILRYFKASAFPELEDETALPLPPDTLERKTGLGYVKTLKPLPEMDATPLRYKPIFLNPMGSDLPVFPGSASTYDPTQAKPMGREGLLPQLISFNQRMERFKAKGKALL